MSKLYKEILVCYDIQDNKKRKKLYEALKDIGLNSIQKSVFWGHANEAEKKAVRREISRYLDHRTDKAFVVDVNLRDKIQTQGFGYGPEDLEPLRRYETI